MVERVREKKKECERECVLERDKKKGWERGRGWERERKKAKKLHFFSRFDFISFVFSSCYFLS